MIDEPITLRVRPGMPVRFPGHCVACGQPARERLTLRKRRGQITRQIDTPLCAECARQLARRSGRQESLLRLSWPLAAVAAIMLALLGLLVLPVEPWWLRLAIGAAAGAAGGAFIRWAMIRRAAAAELPERRAVLDAAQIVDFTWRDMTLLFARHEFAGQVRELNAESIIDDTTMAAAPAEPAGDEAG